MNRIDPRAVKARRITGGISSAVYLAILLAIAWLVVRFGWPGWILAVTGAAAAALAVMELAVLPGIQYRTWRYAITDKEIDLHYGYWVRKRTLIPMPRIQHVNSKQGPVQKGHGLASVTFATAAGSHLIPDLSEEEAERVRRLITELAGAADDEN